MILPKYFDDTIMVVCEYHVVLTLFAASASTYVQYKYRAPLRYLFTPNEHNPTFISLILSMLIKSIIALVLVSIGFTQAAPCECFRISSRLRFPRFIILAVPMAYPGAPYNVVRDDEPTVMPGPTWPIRYILTPSKPMPVT